MNTRTLRSLAAALLVFAGGTSFLQAQEKAGAPTAELPKGFTSGTAAVNGTTIHYVRGGKGPPVILIHGFPEDWFEYHAIMPRLAQRFTVVAVDLRGVGGSAPASGGYDAANMAKDVHELAAALKLERAYLVGHDIGGMVTYAFMRQFPATIRGAMILDAPIPGVDGWSDAMASPAVWHVGFMQVPGLAEKLVAGRTADYLGYFYSVGKFRPEEVNHYVKAAYGNASQLRAMFEIYRAFPANEKFNAAQRDRNDVPLFYAGGDRSPFVKLIPKFAEGFRANGCTNVTTGLIRDSVHYVVSDQPEAVAALIEQHASSPAP